MSFLSFCIRVSLTASMLLCDTNATPKTDFMSLVCMEQCHYFKYSSENMCKWILSQDTDAENSIFLDEIISKLEIRNSYSRAEVIEQAMINTTRWVFENKEADFKVILKYFAKSLREASSKI